MSELWQVKASAGAGKTYQLTRRFLSLLDNSDESASPFVCADRPGKGFAWPEIMAVTFTNKAAAEMKERVVSGLKGIAMGSGDHADVCSPETAHRTLNAILRRYHRLNIRTIDSLLALLLRLFALEFGVRPDFEIVFDEEELFEAVFDHFIGVCETGQAENELLANALDSLVRIEGRNGFFVQDAIRKRLLQLVRFRQEVPGDPLTDQNTLREMLAAEYAVFRKALEDMFVFINDTSLPVAANFKKALAKLDGFDMCDTPDLSSVYLRKEDFRDCVNKAGKDMVEDRDEARYAYFKKKCAHYGSVHPALSGALFLAPVIQIATRLADRLDTLQIQRGKILNSTVAGHVLDFFTNDAVVSEAYCRLGCRLHHILIDEFQDTNRDQWQAITPLAGECLAKNGSLYFVGDVKQAIYSWRGGDSALFDEIMGQPEVAGLASAINAETLPHNWRSSRNVVEFNNRFFSSFEDSAIAADLAERLFADVGAAFVDEFARGLKGNFNDCTQLIPEKAGQSDGYVRMERLPDVKGADAAEEALTRLDALLDDLAARRNFRDIGILVRSHKQASLICDLLVQKNIPVITENSLQLDRHPIVRQLTGLLGFLDFPLDDTAFMTFVMGSEIFLAESGLNQAELLAWLVQPNRKPLGVRFRQDYPKQWQRFIEPFYNQSGLMTPYDLTREAVRIFRVLERHPESELYVRRFLEVIHLAEENGCGSLSAFLEYWAEKSDQEKVPLPENMDAVRIMTIHKSKGLEFPVVIVPFHDWSAKKDKEFAIVEYRGHTLLTPMKKELGPPYFQSLGRVAGEQLNLLYVAWTRAREELYGFFTEKPAGSPALAAMNMLLDLDGNGIFEQGRTPAQTLPSVRPTAPTALEPDGPPPEADLMEWLPRLRVYRHNLEDYFFNERMRGEVAHRAMEMLRVTGDDERDAARAIRLAMEDFPALTALSDEARTSLRGELQVMTRWALSEDRLRAWLSTGLREPEVMDADGKFKRLDLLCRGENSVIVDFKTGQPTPKNDAQVLEYMSLIREMDGGEPQGFLVYLDHREIRQVREEA